MYLAALKKGSIQHAHPYYVIYRSLPQAPIPSLPPFLNILWKWKIQDPPLALISRLRLMYTNGFPANPEV